MSSETPDPRRALRLVQLTDLHLLGDPDGCLRGVATEATLQAVLAAARRDLAWADLLLLTGDLTEHGEAAAYRRLRDQVDALGVAGRVHALPGNHDHPALLAAHLPATGDARAAALACAPWQLLLLDSSVPGQSAGRLDTGQLAWLDAWLAAAEQPHALVVLHHPPLPIGSPWLDAIMLANGADLLAVLDHHPAVRGVLFGHVHQAYERRRRGVRHFATPSTCIQFMPRTERVRIDPRGPGWRTLALYPDGRIRTRVRRAAPLPAQSRRAR